METTTTTTTWTMRSSGSSGQVGHTATASSTAVAESPALDVQAIEKAAVNWQVDEMHQDMDRYRHQLTVARNDAAERQAKLDAAELKLATLAKDREAVGESLLNTQEMYSRTVRQLEAKVAELQASERALRLSSAAAAQQPADANATRSFTTTVTTRQATAVPLLNELRAVRGMAAATTEREHAVSAEAQSLLSGLDVNQSRLLREAQAEIARMGHALRLREDEIEKLDQIASEQMARIEAQDRRIAQLSSERAEMDRELNELRVRAGKWTLENLEITELADMRLELAEWKERAHALQRELELLRRLPQRSVDESSIRRQFEMEIASLTEQISSLRHQNESLQQQLVTSTSQHTTTTREIARSAPAPVAAGGASSSHRRTVVEQHNAAPHRRVHRTVVRRVVGGGERGLSQERHMYSQQNRSSHHFSQDKVFAGERTMSLQGAYLFPVTMHEQSTYFQDYPGELYLRVAQDGLALLNSLREELEAWPFEGIAKFGKDDGVFSFQIGPIQERPGVYYLITNHTDKIFDLVSAQTDALNNLY